MSTALAVGWVLHSSAAPTMPARIHRVPVVSTHLASVGYDRETGVLEVEFRSGAIYRYFSVPAEVHRALMSAESKGRYFAQRIRGHFRFSRISGNQP